MRNIIVQKIFDATNIFTEIEKIKHPISNNNWNFKSDVSASFSIGYDSDHLYLKFYVNESNTKALYTQPNQAVYEDSCVEFFITFDGENYYNLEFNCIGNLLGGYGSGRANRATIESELLQQIKRTPSLGFNKIEIINQPTNWTLEVIIPKSVFKFDKINSFSGLNAKCNFYKCGDKQAFPHFLSWNPILIDTPDFHRPDFFGKVSFQI